MSHEAYSSNCPNMYHSGHLVHMLQGSLHSVHLTHLHEPSITTTSTTHVSS
jgi:hypothetical protein